MQYTMWWSNNGKLCWCVGKDANGKLCWYVGKDDICGGAAPPQISAVPVPPGQHCFKQQHPLECTRLIQKTHTRRTRITALPVLFFLFILLWVDFRFPLHLKSLESSPNHAPSAHLNYVIVIASDCVILVNQKKSSSEITCRSQARRAQHLRAQD